jgi:Flp pilus assembly protein TadG
MISKSAEEGTARVPGKSSRDRLRWNRRRGFARDQRGVAMVEFAICAPVFFLMLFFVFEVAYDMFLQEVLNSALAFTARQMQVGETQQATATGPNSFDAAYFCPNAFGFLNCENLFVRVEVIDSSFANGCTDLYQATTGDLPVSNGTLQLGSFTNEDGIGKGAKISAVPACDLSTGQGYCNPTNSQLVILSAIYVAPSFLNGLLPGTQAYKYNSQYVRAQLATSAFQTEDFAPVTKPVDPCTSTSS